MPSTVEMAVSPELLADLEQAYDFADADSVRAFIVAHPTLVPLLQEAQAVIASSFGTGTRTALEVVRDPEETGTATLYAFVQSPDDADAALDRLDRFNDGWWRSALSSAAVPLHFTLEYV
jgi:hypothetical protein